MKSFKQFINESNSNDSSNFLDLIKKSLINDFNNTEDQAIEFIDLYKDQLMISNENGYTPREAIASTQVPGVNIKDGKTNESMFYNIDIEYDKILDIVESIKTIDDIRDSEDILEKYYNKYRNKSYSDLRIFERVKNNHSNLTMMLENKRNEL